jgi:hypothetical protein
MAGILEEIGKYLQREEPINPEMMPRSYMPESNVMSLAPYMAKGLINDVARYGKQAFTGDVSDRELLPQQPLTGDSVHSIDITPKMRERVKKGLPLFATGGAAIGLTEMMSQQQQEDQRSGFFNSLQY